LDRSSGDQIRLGLITSSHIAALYHEVVKITIFGVFHVVVVQRIDRS
jgi:hypothetical protein